MSISHSLSNALSGMTAASRMAEVVSSNLANAMTDGYGRRTLDLAAESIGGRGAGVSVVGVNRLVDRGIIADRRLADAGLNSFEFLANTMRNLQGVVGETGSGDSISARIAALETALVNATTDPSSQIRLDAVGNRLGELANSLNVGSDNIQSMRVDADRSIADQVEVLNTSLAQVEQLNADITFSRNSGSDPSALMDQRQQVIDRIAAIVPVREMDRDGGQVALVTPSGATLIDGRAREFGFVANPVITAEMTLASGGLTGLTLDGAAIAPDGIGALKGGSLGAAFTARDGELVDAQTDLDRIAADLIGRFQDPAVDSTLVAGDAGLLTDAGAAFDPSNTLGLAGRIAVNGAIDPDQGGSTTNLRDGLNATTPGPTGNASLLQGLLSALSDQRTVAGDATVLGASARAASFEADLGERRLTYESELGFASARWASFKEAEAAGGVDSDYEMQMLLRVEQAYSANARVIQTVESMMQTLMEL